MPETHRLFVGLTLPSEVQAALGAMDPHLRGLRWLPAAQLHLTLSFLGDVETASLDTLKDKLGAVHVPPFFLPLQGIGAFNSRGRPSVVWVGVGKGHPHLFALHKHVQDAVLQAGLEADLRPFHPHVTVGRVLDLSKQALQPFLKQHAEDDFGMFHVDSFTLFSSRLRPDGATYTPLLEVNL
jgi:2'-5' RNA ligase